MPFPIASPSLPHAGLSTALALMPDAALAVDADGVVLAVNERAARMFCAAPAQLAGTPLERLLPGAPGAETGALPVKRLARRLNRVPFQVEASARPVTGGPEGHVVWSLRERCRDALVGEAQRYFDVAFDAAPIGMALFNTDGEYVRVNAALCRILGRAEEELLGCRDQEFTHPDDRQADVEAAWEILEGKRDTHQCEKRFVRPDGAVVWTLANLTFLRDEGGRPLSWVGQFQNITGRRSAEQALRRERDMSAAILASMQEGFVFSCDGEIVNVNEALCRLTGFSRDELIGSRLPFPYWPPERHGELMALRERLAAKESGEFEVELMRRDGSRFDASLTYARAASPDGTQVGFVHTIRDISERKRHEQALERQATIDGLTGLLNRAAFLGRLADAAVRARRENKPLSLALLDLDHFKRINDAHGHPVGDRVLREVAARLRAISRPGDHLARIGGEEFAWLLPDSAGADALRAAERARTAIAETTSPDGAAVTISVGVCDLAGADGDIDELYRLADAALYGAKAQGRNRCVLAE